MAPPVSGTNQDFKNTSLCERQFYLIASRDYLEQTISRLYVFSQVIVVGAWKVGHFLLVFCTLRYYFPLLPISGKDDSETHFVDYLSTINFRSENSKWGVLTVKSLSELYGALLMSNLSNIPWRDERPYVDSWESSQFKWDDTSAETHATLGN